MNKKLKELTALIKKEFGEGSIMMLGDSEPTKIDLIPTGVLSLDKSIGGGFPRGRVVELYGPEAGGKTLTSLYVVAEAQRSGLNCAFIDTEHSLNLAFAKTIGVNIEELLIAQPDNAEDALELAEALARSGDVGVIVLDSVAALVPKAEIEGDMGDSHMGLTARLMSQALRKLTPVLAKSNTTMIFINQVRMKIGVMFGNPETTTGGNALKFYASLRLEVRKGEPIKDKDKQIGHMMNMKVVKNKVVPPFGKVSFPLIYSQGFDIVGDIFNLAVEANIVEKAGAWFSYKGEKLGQGSANATEKLANNPDLLEEITNKVKELK